MGIETAIAATLLGGSAITSAVGQIRQAQQKADVLEKRAKLQRIEAARANQAAREQRVIGQQEAERRRRQGRQQRGGARAAIGASGVQLRGTPTDVLADQALENELNANLATFEAGLRSRELRREQATKLTQANQLDSRASSVETAGFISAGSTLLQKGAQAATMFAGGGGGSSSIGSGRGLAGSGSGTNAPGGPGGGGFIM